MGIFFAHQSIKLGPINELYNFVIFYCSLWTILNAYSIITWGTIVVKEKMISHFWNDRASVGLVQNRLRLANLTIPKNNFPIL